MIWSKWIVLHDVTPEGLAVQLQAIPAERIAAIQFTPTLTDAIIAITPEPLLSLDAVGRTIINPPATGKSV